MKKSSIYGPVKSWRFGSSLGIDPIVESSYCSYNCVYCQLGYIQNITSKRQEFVPLEDFKAELQLVNWQDIDVITFSGSGEPTLALNLLPMIKAVKEICTIDTPVHILTNSTHLDHPDIIEACELLDEICCKIDSVDENKWQKINRPQENVSLNHVLENIRNIAELYPQKTTLQIALLANSNHNEEQLAREINLIKPKTVYLNRPKRPYPKQWELEYRGAHKNQSDDFHAQGKALPRVSDELIQTLMKNLAKYTDVNIEVN